MPKIIIDNVYSKIEGADSYLLEFIDNELSVKQPGYFFSPAFKSGRWDGKIRFLNKKDYSFPTGLLETVLRSSETDFNIEDNRNTLDIKINPEIELYEPEAPGGKITLRDYQYEAVKLAITKTRGIVNVATNGGKTEIASGIMKEMLPYLKKGQRILFVTHSKEIASQSAKRISTRLGMNVGMVGDGVWDEKQITVVMIPTISKHIKEPKVDGVKYTKEMKAIKFLLEFLGGSVKKGEKNRDTLIHGLQILEEQVEKNRDQKAIDIITNILSTEKTENDIVKAFSNLRKALTDFEKKALKTKFEKHEKTIKLLESAVCFIGDEAHRASGDSWLDTLMLCKNAVYRIGLTGTVDRKDEIKVMKLFGLTGGILIKISNEFLIENGYSAKPIIILDTIREPKLSGRLSYPEAYEKGIIENTFRNERIADGVLEKYKQGKGCLVIVSRKKHGANIVKLLEERGVEYEYVDGSSETDNRQQALEDVKSGSLKVLVATNIMDEGVDISNIDAVFMAAGGKSFRQVLQRVGRALRVKKGRENICEIYDYLDFTQKHLTKHTQERYGYYKDESFEIKKIEEM